MALNTTDSVRAAEPLPPEDLTFQPSREVTLGVELELQILDRQSGELAPGALRILDGCADDKLEGVSGEFLLSMLEVRTGVCKNVKEVAETLFPLMRRVNNIAGSLGHDLAVGGTHPHGRTGMNAVFPDERYQRIQSRQGWTASQEPVFGLHIHVGVPSGDAAIGVTNLVVEYLPHLLALSANSPLWQGTDSNYASARSRMYRPAPNVGVPPHFASWNDFVQYCEVMSDAGAVPRTKDIYWDIRPRPHFGTIEFRIFDAPASPAILLGLAALTRCLVIEALRLLAANPELGCGSPPLFWLAQENRWLASRYGLQTLCVRRPGEPRISLLEDADNLFERLAPLAKEVGESSYLKALEPLDQFETGAERQRRIFRDSGAWQSVVEDLKTRWTRELQQRQAPKPAATPAGATPPLRELVSPPAPNEPPDELLAEQLLPFLGHIEPRAESA